MYNKLLKRLYKIYPFRTQAINSYYYREIRVRQLANYLHRLSFHPPEVVDKTLEMIRYIEKLGLHKFIFLCNLVVTGRMNAFINFIEDVVKEEI